MTKMKNSKVDTVFIAKLNSQNKSEFAKKFGVSRQVVQGWSDGRFLPNRDNIRKLVNEHGFEYSDFFIESIQKVEVSDDLLD